MSAPSPVGGRSIRSVASQLRSTLQTGATARRTAAPEWAVAWSVRNAVVFALLIEIAFFAYFTERFLTLGNFRVILIQSAVIAILAVPSALLLMSGYLDLAIGSIVGLSGIVLGIALKAWSLPTALAVTFAVAVAIGLSQGVLATRLGLPFLVVTLGFFSGVRGLALVVSEGQLESGFGDALTFIGRGQVPVLGIPMPIALALGTFAVGILFLYKTRWGRHVVAIGANPEVAYRAGIKVNLLPTLLYVATAVGAALAALVMVARLNATPPTLGSGLELAVLTAVLLGGVAFGGGRGSLLGVAAGVLFVGVLTNGLIHLGVPPFWSPVSVGLALVGAAGMVAVSNRVEARRMSALARPEGRAATTGGRSSDDTAGTRTTAGRRFALPAAGDRPKEGADDSPVLEVRGMSKRYGAVQALENVSLDLRRGEILGLLGDNGAGKSTLVKCLAGSVVPDTGTVAIEGKPVRLANPEAAQRHGVETVFQDLGLVDVLNVTENVFLNRELPTRWPPLKPLGWIDKKRMHADMRSILDELGVAIPSVRVPVAHLSGGQRQIVAVTRGVAWGRKILLMDEPAAALGVAQAKVVRSLAERLSERGISIVYISHNMQEVVELCHRAVVLRHGRKIADLELEGVSARDLVDLITGARSDLEPRRGSGEH